MDFMQCRIRYFAIFGFILDFMQYRIGFLEKLAKMALLYYSFSIVSERNGDIPISILHVFHYSDRELSLEPHLLINKRCTCTTFLVCLDPNPMGAEAVRKWVHHLCSCWHGNGIISDPSAVRKKIDFNRKLHILRMIVAKLDAFL